MKFNAVFGGVFVIGLSRNDFFPIPAQRLFAAKNQFFVLNVRNFAVMKTM